MLFVSKKRLLKKRQALRFITFLRFRNGIGKFFQLGHKKPIHVVGVRIETACGFQGRMETTLLKPREMQTKSDAFPIPEAFQQNVHCPTPIFQNYKIQTG